ncbi:MAG: DUF1778 domain-containing protein [bacterium]
MFTFKRLFFIKVFNDLSCKVCLLTFWHHTATFRYNQIKKEKEHYMPVSKKANVSPHVFQVMFIIRSNKAAELAGATLNQFLVQSAHEKAQAVIEKESIIHMTIKSSKTFSEAIENPTPPHAK